MGGIPVEKALSALGNVLSGLKNKIPFLKDGNDDEATIIDGKKIAADIRLEIKAEVDESQWNIILSPFAMYRLE